MSDNTYEAPAAPGTREEEYYDAILKGLSGGEPGSIPAPAWRVEQYLAAIALAAQGAKELPDVTAEDAGKVLAVDSDGSWGLSDDTVEQAVASWLDDHPEATTTVQDGAITKAKLNSALSGSIASDYSTSATYAVGDYVWYNGSLYRCTTAITTAETWTAAHWTVAVIGNDVSDLKNAIGDFIWSKTAVSRFIDIPVSASSGDVIYIKPIVWTGAVANFTVAGYKNGQLQPSATSVLGIGYEKYYTVTDNYDSFRVSAATAAPPSSTETLAILFVNITKQNALSEISLKNKKELCDYIPYGKYNGTFTAQQQLASGITLFANTTYLIKCSSNLTDRVNAFSNVETSNYKSLTPWRDTIRLTTGNRNGILYFYNPNTNLDTLDITVYIDGNNLPKLNEIPSIYIVDKHNPAYADYTSVTACLLELKDDKSPKVIYINGGDYDIHQEYVDANVPVYTGSNPSTDYWDYNVWIPENTHIIGRGIVRLMWMPDVSEITENQSKTVSPVNVAGTMTLENVEIHCKNGRYCIHDDPNGQAKYTNAIKKYINVKCYKYANDSGYGFAPAIGFGIDACMYYEFDNCMFKNIGNERAFYIHSRRAVGGYPLTEYQSSNLVINNCILDSGTYTTVAKLGNVGNNSNLHIRVVFNSCSFNNNVRCFIQAINESGSSPVNPNAFDITLNRCSANAEVYIADSDNQYPPVIVQ